MLTVCLSTTEKVSGLDFDVPPFSGGLGFRVYQRDRQKIRAIINVRLRPVAAPEERRRSDLLAGPDFDPDSVNPNLTLN